MTSIRQVTVVAALERLGIAAGDRVIVHSSLSSMGHVLGGAPTVCAAFMERLTAAGTLLMPSFNHGTAYSVGGCFCPTETRTTNGIIPDTFWRLPGVLRSLHPTHPFACWGRHARELIAGHHLTLTMGRLSPLGLLEAMDGKAVLIGVPQANTFHHVVETSARVPCLGVRTTAYSARLPNGEPITLRAWSYRSKPCPITDAGLLYYDAMRVAGTLREGTLGTATVLCFRLADCRRALEPFIEGAVAGYGCRICPIRPAVGPRTVASDWDPDQQCLRPDSNAYRGPWPLV